MARDPDSPPRPRSNRLSARRHRPRGCATRVLHRCPTHRGNARIGWRSCRDRSGGGIGARSAGAHPTPSPTSPSVSPPSVGRQTSSGAPSRNALKGSTVVGLEPFLHGQRPTRPGHGASVVERRCLVATWKVRPAPSATDTCGADRELQRIRAPALVERSDHLHRIRPRSRGRNVARARPRRAPRSRPPHAPPKRARAIESALEVNRPEKRAVRHHRSGTLPRVTDRCTASNSRCCAAMRACALGSPNPAYPSRWTISKNSPLIERV